MQHRHTLPSPQPLESSPVFPANIAAIAAFAPGLAKALLETRPREDVEFYTTDEGVLSASVGVGSAAKLLASRRRPLEEGRRLAEMVNFAQAAGVLVLGFGAGHHARMLVERLPRPTQGTELPPWGVVVIY